MAANTLNINEYLDDNTLQDIEYNLFKFAKSWQQYGSDPNILEQNMRADIDMQIAYDDDETPEEYTPEPANIDDALNNIHQFRQSTRGTKKDKTPITPQLLRDVMGVVTGGLTNKTAAFRNAERKATSYRTAWAEQEMDITAGHAKVGKRDMNYKLVRNPVGWGAELSDDPSKTFDNLNLIKNRISCDVYNQFGGWSRIFEIVIVDGQLIINNIMYVPLIEPQYINRLPLDSADYIRNGCVAPLFDWSFLRKMHNLVTFICDDPTLYVTNIADDVGFGRRIGACSLFRICKKLNFLGIGSEEITRESLYQPESVEIKKSIEKQKRFQNITDGFCLNIRDTTEGWYEKSSSWLRSYSYYRGDKNRAVFGLGVAARAGLFASTSILNFIAQIAGATRDAFKEYKNVSTDPTKK